MPKKKPVKPSTDPSSPSPISELGSIPKPIRPLPPKNAVSNPLGAGVYGEKILRNFTGQPLEKQAGMLRQTWIDTAYVLATRCKSLSKKAGALDYNALYRIILSAGIAYDKAFPKQETPTGQNVVALLFGNIPSQTLSQIVQPSIPAIRSNPSVVPPVLEPDVQDVEPLSTPPISSPS